MWYSMNVSIIYGVLSSTNGSLSHTHCLAILVRIMKVVQYFPGKAYYMVVYDYSLSIFKR